jgi:hypothetical protein
VPSSSEHSRNPNAGIHKVSFAAAELILIVLVVFDSDANEYLSRFAGGTSGTEEMVTELIKERLSMPKEDRPVSDFGLSR